MAGQFGLLAGASVGGQLVGFLVLAVVTRRIGPDHLGAWYLASSVVSYFGLLVGLGMATRATRDIAQDPGTVRRVSGEVVSTSMLLATGVFALLVVLTPTIAGGSNDLRALLPIAGLMLLVNAVTLEWALQALRTVRALAFWRLLGQIVYGLSAVLFVTTGIAGAIAYAAFNVVGMSVTAAGTWWSVGRQAGRPILFVSWRRMVLRLRSSIPFGITLVMTQTYWSLGLVLLGFLGSERAVGEYGVAQKLPQVAITLTLLWVSTLFPHSAALYKRDPSRLKRQLERIAVLGFLLLAPIVIIGPFIGGDLMAFMFGEKFRGAGNPFSYLSLLAVVTFISVNFTNTLLAIGGETRIMRYAAAAGVLAVAINLVLIPKIGSVAPAVATIAAEVVVGSLAVRRMAEMFGEPIRLDFAPIFKVLPAIVLSTVTMVATESFAWPMRAAAALVIYLVAAFTFRAIRLEDLKGRNDRAERRA